MQTPTSLSGSSRVLIAIPNMGWLVTGLFAPLMHWIRNYGAEVYAPEGLQPLAYARNTIAQRFMDSDATHLLFVDDDVTPPFDSLKLLLDADKEMVTGVYPMRKRDSDGVVKTLWIVARNSPEGPRPLDGEGIEPIDYCGGGLMLISRSVFEAIPFPWFEDRSYGEMRGDFLFCKKVREAGIEIFAHFGVKAAHRKEVDL